MNLKQIFEHHALHQGTGAPPELKKLKGKMFAKEVNEILEQLFEKIPESAVPFSQTCAWNVVEDDGRLPHFTAFIFDVMRAGPVGHKLHVPHSQMDQFAFRDNDHLVYTIYELNQAWQEHIRALVQNQEKGVNIIFIAI